ncbi:unnamed protein product [Sphagnum balticum]
MGPLSTIAPYACTFKDANDNSPIMHRCPRTVRITENLPSTIVALLDATDIDRDTHLTYSIVRGNTSAFGVDAHTGELYTLVPLTGKRSTRMNYSFKSPIRVSV